SKKNPCSYVSDADTRTDTRGHGLPQRPKKKKKREKKLAYLRSVVYTSSPFYLRSAVFN
ncbi:hypothetical protein GIB67_011078, partial [Kingdonia uniflora]